MSIQIHERYFVVEKAKSQIITAIWDVVQGLDEGITMIELAWILSDLPNSMALRYALREERHGTTEKKADEA